MRQTERIDQNTIKITDLRKKTWKIPENNVSFLYKTKMISLAQGN